MSSHVIHSMSCDAILCLIMLFLPYLVTSSCISSCYPKHTRLFAMCHVVCCLVTSICVKSGRVLVSHPCQSSVDDIYHLLNKIPATLKSKNTLNSSDTLNSADTMNAVNGHLSTTSTRVARVKVCALSPATAHCPPGADIHSTPADSAPPAAP